MKSLVIAFLVLCMVLVGSSCRLPSLTRGLDEILALEIHDIDLSSIANGNYRGTYNCERWKNTLEVTVQDHAITAITIIKDVTFAKSEVTDAIFSKVIQSQSLQVDAVSGSTVTSKAYLKSMELALENL
ncbi:MAG: FMN-binding protein [Spirochaetae bacterium HGW-Spirochaetae-8]|nr:MAG: FMN-binding protein [Spirochaetae bacterium HGW-Spirochaetae-8]